MKDCAPTKGRHRHERRNRRTTTAERSPLGALRLHLAVLHPLRPVHARARHRGSVPESHRLGRTRLTRVHRPRQLHAPVPGPQLRRGPGQHRDLHRVRARRRAPGLAPDRPGAQHPRPQAPRLLPAHLLHAGRPVADHHRARLRVDLRRRVRPVQRRARSPLRLRRGLLADRPVLGAGGRGGPRALALDRLPHDLLPRRHAVRAEELYEAAEVDGAGPVRRFFSVTLPQLKPITAFIAVIMLVNTAQIFEEPFLLTQGGPGESTLSVSMFVYRAAFQRQELGYAAAAGVVMFVIVFALGRASSSAMGVGRTR
ncbi:carbohydrate ABC transporter permease [Glycomyces tarimensis]